jgi:hypothetical protein
MTALSKTKTWAHTNVSVADGAGPTPTGAQTNADIGNRQLLYDIKIALVAGNWSVVSSSGWTGAAFTAGAGDNWGTSTGVNWIVSGEHGWIVLQNNAISTGFQICLDLNYAETTTEKIDMWVSYASGFTGGTVSARPTATDEWKSLDNVSWMSGANSNRGASIFLSSDGECTRFVTSRNTGFLRLWCFEKFPSPNSAWPRPYVAFGSEIPSHGNLFQANNIPIETPEGTISAFLGLPVNGLGESVESTKLNSADVGGDWVCPPVSLVSDDSSFVMYLDRFFDFWVCAITYRRVGAGITLFSATF